MNLFGNLKLYCFKLLAHLFVCINVWSYRSIPGQNPLLAALARRKRALGLNDDNDNVNVDEENDPNISKILIRTVADDQVEILKVS